MSLVVTLEIFGSQRRGEFVLDTVFVVADSLLHTASDWRSSLADRITGTYADVTMRPIYEGDRFGEQPRLYFGATRDDPVDGMFSFVPCLPQEAGVHGFPRPRITLPGLVNPAQTMGMKGRGQRSPDEIRAAWDSVVQQVTGSQLMLGVRLAVPPMSGAAAGSDHEQDPAADAPRIRC